MPGFDLHTHGVASDGTTTVGDNLRAAATMGLEGLGIAAHARSSVRSTSSAGGSDLHGTAGPNRLGRGVTQREVVAAWRERCPIRR